jgi:outer membrane protein TolC
MQFPGWKWNPDRRYFRCSRLSKKRKVLMKEPLLPFAYKARLVLCGLGCLMFIGTPSQGQFNVFSRYAADQERRTVVVPPTQIDGLIRDGKVFLTEQQAIEMALRHNLEVNIERHNPIFSLWAVREREGLYDPLGSFEFNWDRDKRPTSSALQGGTSITNILTGYRFGYDQRFSTGTSWGVNFSGFRNQTTSFFSSLVPALDTSFEILFRQHLLEGFGGTRDDNQLEISQTNLEISQQEFRRRTSEVILQVQQLYWDVRFTLEDIEAREKALETAQAILNQNEARFEVGSASRLEVVQGKAEFALTEELLIRARYRYRRTQDQLIRLISNYQDPRSFPAEIVPADQPDSTPEPPQPFERLQATAEKLRPELQQAELEVENQRTRLDLSRNELRPTLDLVAGYQQYGLGGPTVERDFSRGFTDPEIIGILPGGLGDSLDKLFSSDFYGYVVGLELQLPLFNREDRAKNAQAQIRYDQSILNQENIKQLISMEIRDSLSRIEMNHASLRTGETGRLAAQERLQAERARFEVGRGTTRALIEAQRDLLLAELIFVRAETDLMKNRALLNRALGRTFQRHNIHLREALETNLR